MIKYADKVFNDPKSTKLLIPIPIFVRETVIILFGTKLLERYGYSGKIC